MTFARNVHFTVKDGKAEEFNRLMHTEVLPRLKGQRGFRQELTILGNDAVLEGTPRVDTYDTVVTTSR